MWVLEAEGGGSDTTTVNVVLNSTNGNLAVAMGAWTGFVNGTFSDSEGNTWTQLTERIATNVEGQLAYAFLDSVAASHTFTLTTGGDFPQLYVYVFSGASSSPFDQESGAAVGSGTSGQPGSITPGQPDSLFVAGAVWNDEITGPSIDSGFGTIDQVDPGGGGKEIGISFLAQSGGPSAVNPTWSWTTSRTSGLVMATFNPQVAGGQEPGGVSYQHSPIRVPSRFVTYR